MIGLVDMLGFGRDIYTDDILGSAEILGWADTLSFDDILD